MMKNELSLKEALLFNQRMIHLSKALWKMIEKDWQTWIKPYDININEHHILCIAYQFDGATISDISKFGMMHVSTAFNFSKKLEGRGLVEFSKRETDKRNTYVQITEKGRSLYLEIMKGFEPETNIVLQSTFPIKELYGRYPDLSEVMAIVRYIYGDDFTRIFEKSYTKLNDDFVEEDGQILLKDLVKQKEPI